jgi:flagellar basal body rod protein FlgG
MAGGQYIALSGMRTRIDELDRIAADLANSATSGYKGERTGHESAPRPFETALATAIDVSMGGRRLDMRSGAVSDTGRPLDVAIEGPGFLTVQTAQGPRYTRNGHFTQMADGTLTTVDGAVVMGTEGPLKLGKGEITIESDGTVRTGETVAGRIALVEFADPGQLVREGGALLSAGAQTPTEATHSGLKPGALEGSNVSVVDRVASLTSVSRSFEALQKAVSVLMNDVDGRTIDHLGRR